MTMLVINADFREPDHPSFSYLEDGGEVVVMDSPDAFVDHLQEAATAGKRIVHFNGVSYIFSGAGLLGACSPDRRGAVRSIALHSVDIMVAFFLDHGYPVAWRRIETVTAAHPDGHFPYLSQMPSEETYSHDVVLRGIAAIVTTLRTAKRLRWLPKSRGNVQAKRAKTSSKVWVPESVPEFLAVDACIAAWDKLDPPPNAWMADSGGSPPMTMLPTGTGRAVIPGELVA